MIEVRWWEWTAEEIDGSRDVFRKDLETGGFFERAMSVVEGRKKQKTQV